MELSKRPELHLSVPKPSEVNLCPGLKPSEQLAVCDFKTSGLGVMLQSKTGEASIIGHLCQCMANIHVLAGLEKPMKLPQETQDLLIMGIMEVVRDFRNLTFGQFKRALLNGMSGKYDPEGKVYGFTAKDVRQWLNGFNHELRTELVDAIQKQHAFECSSEEERQEERRKAEALETRKALIRTFALAYEELRAAIGGKTIGVNDIPEEIDRGNILYKAFWKAHLIRCTQQEFDELVELKKQIRISELPGILRARTRRSERQGDSPLIDHEREKAKGDARSHLLRKKVADCLSQDMPVELILQKLK